MKIVLTKFKVFLLIYSFLLVVAIEGVLIWLRGLLVDYEAASPIITMNAVMEDFEADISAFLIRAGIEPTEFEDAQTIARLVEEKAKQTNITYRKFAGEYSEQTPVYEICADEKPIAKLTLAEKGENAHGFMEWKFGGIEVLDYLERQSVTVKVPEGSTLLLNGVAVPQTYQKAEKEAVTLCENVLDYVKQPYYVTYQVDGLLMEPKVTISQNGVSLEPVRDEKKKDYYMAEFPSDSVLIAEQQDAIIDIMESYAKYMINRGDLRSLRRRMVGTASENMSDIKYINVYLIGQRFEYTISGQSLKDFKKYSEDCFSCEVSCKLYVKYGAGNYHEAGETTYDIRLTYVFVKVDGEWKLGDFIIL